MVQFDTDGGRFYTCAGEGLGAVVGALTREDKK